IGCASVLIAAVLVRTFEAARDVQTLLLTMFFVLGLAFAATPVNRISVHMAAITGTSVVFQLLFGTIGFAVLPLVALVGLVETRIGRAHQGTGCQSRCDRRERGLPSGWLIQPRVDPPCNL